MSKNATKTEKSKCLFRLSFVQHVVLNTVGLDNASSSVATLHTEALTATSHYTAKLMSLRLRENPLVVAKQRTSGNQLGLYVDWQITLQDENELPCFVRM